MVNIHCQPQWPWDHLGDTPLDVPVRGFPEECSWEEKTYPEHEQHYPNTLGAYTREENNNNKEI